VKYKEDLDFKWIEFNNSDITGIELLTGKYSGVVYHYSKARVVEEGEVARLQFGYTIVHPGKHDIDELTKDEIFVTIMGDMLNQILMSRVKNDETGTDDPKEFNLQ
jgi:hypothetical protein